MPTTPEPGLLQLLYLYFIPYWLFRDVSHGDQMLREQNYRYNREQRKYLPGYLLKWAILCALLLASHQLARVASASSAKTVSVLVNRMMGMNFSG